jgi:hypothetical protein
MLAPPWLVPCARIPCHFYVHRHSYFMQPSKVPPPTFQILLEGVLSMLHIVPPEERGAGDAEFSLL